MSDYGTRSARIYSQWLTRVSLLAALSCGVAVFGMAEKGDADSLPRPEGYQNLSGPYQSHVGERLVQGESFSIQKSAAEIHAFYKKALLQHGWRLEALPWEGEQAEAKIQDLIKAREDPRAQKDPQTKAQIDQVLAQLRAAREQMLYAAKDRERLQIRMAPAGGVTWVSLSQWKESSATAQPPWLEQAPGSSSLPGSSATSSLSGGKPCCGVDQAMKEVPESERKMPQAIPRYPQGRLVATSVIPSRGGGQAAIFEVYRSGDVPEQVKAFYGREMAYNGWSTWDLPMSDQMPQHQMPGMTAEQRTQMQQITQMMNTTRLAFRKLNALCTMTAVQMSEAMSQRIGIDPQSLLKEAPQLSELLKSASPGGGAQPQQAAELPKERTMIIVTYYPSLPTLSVTQQDYGRSPLGKTAH